LRQGGDYPYFETKGFSAEFVEQEKRLCVYDLQGQLLRDTGGNPILECMCGNVICGRFNPEKPFFTKKGSFWTNCTTKLLATTSEAERQAHTRNRCNGEGYESVALIPLRASDQTFGLLQLNDRRCDRFTPAKIVLFERLADSLAIALAQRQTEMALHESEYFFKESQRVGFIGSYKTDFVKGYWESSEILNQIFGIDQDYDRSIPGWLDIVHPDDQEMMGKYLEDEVIGQHKRFDAEYRIVRKQDHAIRWVHGLGEVDFDKQGNILSMIGTIQDITERKLVEEALRTSLAEKEILLKEVHHRVKNNLASINGLIELQQETLSGAIVISELTELGGRIHSMALVHELLYQSESLSRIDLSHYFEMLTSHIRTSYERSPRINLLIDANGVEMDLDNAIPCGLIVNELVTNSFKYAFPDGKSGFEQGACEISVSAKKDGDAYVLVISDNGVGFPPAFDWKTSQSLGLQLVMLLSQRQLKGRVELESNAGVSFRLRFVPKHNMR
jgi:PAS domain S-box-containing protein